MRRIDLNKRDPQDCCPFIYKDEATFQIVCPLCGFEDYLKRLTPIHRLQRSRRCEVRAATHQLGWGDKTERRLSRLGITKARWARWTIWWRKTRKQTLGCNKCGKRQERMNQWGWKFRYWLNRKTWPVKWAWCRLYCWLLPQSVAQPTELQESKTQGRARRIKLRLAILRSSRTQGLERK